MLRLAATVASALAVLVVLGAGCAKKAEVTPAVSVEPAPTPPPQEPAPPETSEPAAAPAKVEGAIEGEDLKVIEKTAGETESQDMTGFGSPATWNGDHQLWWHDNEPGARLSLGFEVPESGTYRVLLYLTYSYDYAVVTFTLDDQSVGRKVDLFAPETRRGEETRTVTGSDVPGSGTIPIGITLGEDLGEHELTKGEHRLGVEIVGINEQATEKGYSFGLDCLELKPMPAAP